MLNRVAIALPPGSRTAAQFEYERSQRNNHVHVRLVIRVHRQARANFSSSGSSETQSEGASADAFARKFTCMNGSNRSNSTALIFVFGSQCKQATISMQIATQRNGSNY